MFLFKHLWNTLEAFLRQHKTPLNEWRNVQVIDFNYQKIQKVYFVFVFSIIHNHAPNVFILLLSLKRSIFSYNLLQQISQQSGWTLWRKLPRTDCCPSPPYWGSTSGISWSGSRRVSQAKCWSSKYSASDTFFLFWLKIYTKGYIWTK